VEWLLLAVFGIMWAAFLVPWGRRRSEAGTVSEHERRMEFLANAEVHGTAGRWIVTPRKGMRFLGPQERERARARERRRRVFVFLLEGLGLSFLIGLVPPLRPAWAVSVGFGVLLLLYTWALLAIKARTPRPHEQVAAALLPERASRAIRPRYAGMKGIARPTVDGLGSLGEGDRVHVVVRTASA
jgi:Flp pilus assembly protein TadB